MPRRAECRPEGLITNVVNAADTPAPTHAPWRPASRRANPFDTHMRAAFGFARARAHAGHMRCAPPELDVVVEVPRGSFVKRTSTGRIACIAPLPCPFNYGAVPNLLGHEGDLLDAVVLGPRLAVGRAVRIKARGAVTLTDRGMWDDKLICADQPLSVAQYAGVLRFFRFYAKCKAVSNMIAGWPGHHACDGWRDAGVALARARPRDASRPKPSAVAGSCEPRLRRP